MHTTSHWIVGKIGFPLVAMALTLVSPCNFALGSEPPVVAQTTPSVTLVLRAKELGYIDDLLVEKGTTVAKGQIVARLDCWHQLYNIEVAKRKASDNVAVRMAEADLRDKDASRKQAFIDFKRREITEAQFVAATTHWELSKCRLDIAVADLEHSKLNLELAERALDDRFVRSPFAGKVIEVIKTLGERTEIGNGIVTVGDFSKLKGAISLSKNEASQLATDGFLMVKTSQKSHPVKAYIESISDVPNSPSGQKVVNLIIPNPEEKPSNPLHPGNLPQPSPTDTPPGSMGRSTEKISPRPGCKGLNHQYYRFWYFP